MTGRDRHREPKTASDEEDNFLGRWSKRKAKARTAETAAVAEQPIVDSAVDEASQEGTATLTADTDGPESQDTTPFDVDSLPDIDSLGPSSDFRMFMQAGVPPELKTKALRRLWRVKSELANLDGLVDYGEDLTGSFKVVDHLKTAYEVGRGFLKDDETGEDQKVASASDMDGEENQAATVEERTSDTGEIDAQSGDDIDKVEAGNIEKREG